MSNLFATHLFNRASPDMSEVKVKRGRPPLPESARLNAELTTRFTDSEMRKLSTLSKKLGLPKGRVIRHLLSQA